MQEIYKLTDQVEEILRDFPESRNSDTTLMIELWKRFYPEALCGNGNYQWGIEFKSLYNVPSESAIGRIRRHIQGDEDRTAYLRYLPTSREVARQRRINEAIWWLAMNS